MKRQIPGATLLELMLSVGIASLLTLTLLFLFTHSHAIFLGEGSQSQELRSLGFAMREITDKLSLGSVYLVKGDNDFLLGKPASHITVEQFSSLYHSDAFLALSFENRRLVEKDYGAAADFSLSEALQKPDKQITLASRLQSATFTLKPPHALQITLSGPHFTLQSEIPNVKMTMKVRP